MNANEIRLQVQPATLHRPSQFNPEFRLDHSEPRMSEAQSSQPDILTNQDNMSSYLIGNPTNGKITMKGLMKPIFGETTTGKEVHAERNRIL